MNYRHKPLKRYPCSDKSAFRNGKIIREALNRNVGLGADHFIFKGRGGGAKSLKKYKNIYGPLTPTKG